MKTDLQLHDDHARLTLRGDFDAFEHEPFLRRIDQLAAAGHADVRLDLLRVTFFGSRAVTALLRAQRRLREAGGRLRIERPAPAVRQVLAALGLEGAFEVAAARRGRAA